MMVEREVYQRETPNTTPRPLPLKIAVQGRSETARQIAQLVEAMQRIGTLEISYTENFYEFNDNLVHLARNAQKFGAVELSYNQAPLESHAFYISQQNDAAERVRAFAMHYARHRQKIEANTQCGAPPAPLAPITLTIIVEGE